MNNKWFIINMTQHYASDEQKRQGVIDLPEIFRKELIELLTFENFPKYGYPRECAWAISTLLLDCYFDYADIDPAKRQINAMIGGAPYLMPPLEKALFEVGVYPIYAYSERQSFEHNVGGKIEKTSQFVHAGWVCPEPPVGFWEQFTGWVRPEPCAKFLDQTEKPKV
jgi:hypothetical protein